MNEANQLSEMWRKIKVRQSLKRKYASMIICGHIIPSTRAVCFRFMNVLTVVFREIFDFFEASDFEARPAFEETQASCKQL